MNAVALLKKQHEETRKLFQRVGETEGAERRVAFQKLADALAAHATIEEQFLYPEIARMKGMRDLAHDAVEEHLAVKRLLADLLERDLDEPVFAAKCRLLEAEVDRHVEEEEAAMLPMAKRKLGQERLEQLGQEMKRAFDDLMQHEPRRMVPRETEQAPTLP